MNQSTIEEIIRCDSLQLYEEGSLLEFVTLLYENDHTNSILFEYIQFLNVSNVSFECFKIQNFNIELINSNIWESIRFRFNQNENRYLSKVIEIQYIKDKKIYAFFDKQKWWKYQQLRNS